MAFQVVAAPNEPDLLFLPWEQPLEQWPDDATVALPKGISRHIVRFVRLNSVVYAIKETEQHVAEQEYELLNRLIRRGVPCVEPVGIISGRTTPEGEELPAALVTQHLQFSLPFRALFSSTLRPDTTERLLDALALLLVRLHLVGFYWGDCSLSNTLFRRDAGSFAAYLVDAETGDFQAQLSEGQRNYDVDLAVTNATGELMDLESAGLLHETIEPISTGEKIRHRYERLWDAITKPLVMKPGERYKLDERMRSLNEMGFDVAEMLTTTPLHPADDGIRIVMTPKVVDAGHHARRLIRLTGLDVEENQARSLLNDLDQFRVHLKMPLEDEELVAHRWVSAKFEPVLALVPREMRGKLEPAEIYHEILQHRWFMSEQAGRDVGRKKAAEDYVKNVLSRKPEERAIIGTTQNQDIEHTQEMRLVFPESATDFEGRN